MRPILQQNIHSPKKRENGTHIFPALIPGSKVRKMAAKIDETLKEIARPLINTNTGLGGLPSGQIFHNLQESLFRAIDKVMIRYK